MGVGGWGTRSKKQQRSPTPNPQPLTPSLAFFASLIVGFQQVRPIFGPGGDLLGLRVRALVTKNRLAAPGGLAEFDVLRGHGVRKAAEVLELGLALGLIERCPQGLVWGRVWLGRGLAAAQAELESDPDLAAAVAAGVRGWGLGAGGG